ncbi:MAG: GtrA family protein [Patescibacteria group bacterium]
MKLFSRFIGYSILGTSAFAIDLGLIYIFYEIAKLPYTMSVPLAFLIATSIHYTAARALVFHDTTRSISSGYLLFIGIMVTNALIITGLAYMLVEYAHVNLYIARIGVAGIIGLVSFYMNARYNFKVWHS